MLSCHTSIAPPRRQGSLQENKRRMPVEQNRLHMAPLSPLHARGSKLMLRTIDATFSAQYK
jgi:hypothetical protein